MTNKIPKAGDYVKTISKRFKNGPWRGRIRRPSDMSSDMYLIEWNYMGSNPIDICTWVFADEIKITKRVKTQK